MSANEIASMLFRVNRKPFEVKVHGLQSFGGRKPRAVVASVEPCRPLIELQAELDVSGSNLSHHLEKLKHQGLVRVAREGTYLRYTASTEALQELLGFLYAECCTRNKAIRPGAITKPCK
jgi:DNA-binding transcriptional ArsR family regulator